MRRKAAVVLFAAILVFLGFLRESQARKINVALPSLNMLAIAFTTAKERKYYTDEGLDVQLIVMGAPVAIQALIGGNVEFATVSGASLPPIIRGAPLRIIFSSYFRPMFWLYARPEIAHIRELRGKKAGVSGIGSGPATLLAELLKRYGLEAGRDVPMISLGAMPNIAAALLSGSIDAAMIGPPFNVTVREAGFRELVSFLKEEFVEAQGSIVVREELVQSDQALVESFVRATYKGLLYARENRSGTIPILVRYLKIKEDAAAKYYDSVRPVMTADGTLSPEFQIKFIDQGLKRLAVREVLPPEKVFDYLLVRKIRAELEAKRWRP